MTVSKWIISGVMLLIGFLCISLARDFSKAKPIVLKSWLKCKGKIVESDDLSFTVEYEHRHHTYIYTFQKEHFYWTMGFTPEAHRTVEAAMWIEKQKYLLNSLLKKGYTHDYFFRLDTGKKLLVWADPEAPQQPYKVWSDDSAANRSAARAFYTIGISILTLLILTVYSTLTK